MFITFYLELEMYRKCIKTSTVAIENDPFCLRAYLLQGKSYKAIGKVDAAKRILSTGFIILQGKGCVVDAFIVREIQKLLVELNADLQFSNDSKMTTTSYTPSATVSPQIHDKIQIEAVNNNIEDINISSVINSKQSDIIKIDQKSKKKTSKTSVAKSLADPLKVNSCDNSTKSSKEKVKVHHEKKTVMPNSGILADYNAMITSTLQSPHEIEQSITKDALLVIHKQYIGDGENQIKPSILEAVRSKVFHATGDTLIDDLISLGYLQVNTDNLNNACEIFLVLLRYKPDLAVAHLGMGSILALTDKFDEAIKSFSLTIKYLPTESDGWKRRGQTLAATGKFEEALADLSQAEALDSDPDIFFQQGLVYHQLKNYRKALNRFRVAEEKGYMNAQLFNIVGICEGQLGNAKDAIIAHEKAFEQDKKFKEALLNKANMYKELFMWEEADKWYQAAIALSTKSDPFPIAHSYRAQLLYSLGRPKEALTEILSTLTLLQNKVDVQCTLFAALCWQSLGHYKQACDYYDRVLIHDPKSICLVLRDLAYYMWINIDRDISTFCIDNDLDFCIKESVDFSADYQALKRPDSFSVFSDKDFTMTFEKILHDILPISRWMNSKCLSFVPNVRYYTAFGIAAIQIGQLVRKHVYSINLDGPGILIPNERSSLYSTPNTTTLSSTGKRGIINQHIFEWRDMFDIILTWQQINDFQKPSYWIDRLSQEVNDHDYAVMTPIIAGHLRVIRFQKYFDKIFQAFKKLVISEKVYFLTESHDIIELSEETLKQLEKCQTLHEIGEIIQRPTGIYVVKPCWSQVNGTTKMDGQTMSLCFNEQNEGLEFTLVTLINKKRTKEYSSELTRVFNKVLDTLNDQLNLRQNNKEERTHELIDVVLEFFYYWIIYSPLTRFNDYCGYVVLYSLFLADGKMPQETLPVDMLLNIEAILAENVTEFVNLARPMFQLKPCTEALDIDQFKDIEKIHSFRHMIYTLTLTKACNYE